MTEHELKVLSRILQGDLNSNDVALSREEALDLVSAIANLRSWEEVQANSALRPFEVTDASAVERLCHRIEASTGFSYRPEMLMKLLSSPSRNVAHDVAVWPRGVEPGVYIAGRSDGVEAFLEQYQDESDGAYAYAYPGEVSYESRRLRESYPKPLPSLNFDVLAAIPSGSVVVVGAYYLSESSWDAVRTHLLQACGIASTFNLRMVFHVNAANTETLLWDLRLAAGVLQDSPLSRQIKGKTPGGWEDSRGDPTNTPPPHDDFELEPPPGYLRRYPDLMERLLAAKSGLVLLAYKDLKSAEACVGELLQFSSDVSPTTWVGASSASFAPFTELQCSEVLVKLDQSNSFEAAKARGYRRFLVELSGDILWNSLQCARRHLVIGLVRASDMDTAMCRVFDGQPQLGYSLSAVLRAVVMAHPSTPGGDAPMVEYALPPDEASREALGEAAGNTNQTLTACSALDPHEPFVRLAPSNVMLIRAILGGMS